MSTDITHISSFVVKELVGQGSFSEVYNCCLPDCEDCMFAIKRLLSTCSSKKIINEVTSLYLLKDCPNAVHLLGVIMEKSCLDLIFPLVDYDDFTLFIRDCSFRDMQNYMKNLLSAVCQLHSKGIIHRDIKPRNFLYSKETGKGVLIDFGLAEVKEGLVDDLLKTLSAQTLEKEKQDEVNLIINVIQTVQKTNRKCTVCKDPNCTGFAHTSGTTGFRAPEVLTKVIHQTSALDIWSCGIVFMCILARRYPLFYQKSSLNEYYELMEFCSLFGSETVIQGLNEMNRHVDNLCFVEPAPLRDFFIKSGWIEWEVDLAMDLLMKMLVINPKNRITAEQALKHPFFMICDCLFFTLFFLFVFPFCFGRMSTEDDLLNDFFAEINSLPTPSLNTEPEKKKDVIITNTSFVECSDPIVSQPTTVKPRKEKQYQSYTAPKLAEVDPEEKKKERLDKFFKSEVENLKKSRVHKRRANGVSWEDATLAEWNETDFRLFVGNLGREVTTEVLANLFRQRYTSFTMARVVESKIWKGSAGYGFVAFSDPLEGIKAMKEMNGKLCGSRPMKISKSDWKSKYEKEVRKKEKKEARDLKSISKVRTSYS